LSRLTRKRSTLQRRLQDIDDQIRRIDGGTRSTASGRARNAKSLVVVIGDVLQRSGKPMRVSDIAAAAQAAGYQSSSPNFRSIVNQMLIKNRSRFTSADRGFYHIKK
jgi:hypothetical protein